MTRARPSPFLVQNHKSKANLCQPKTLTIRRSSPTRQTMNPQTRTAQPTNQEVGIAAGATVGTAHTPEGTPIVQSRDESMLPRSEPSTPVKPAVESSAPVLGAAVSETQSTLAQPLTAAPPPLSPVPSPDSRIEPPALNTQGSDTKSQAPDSSRTQTTESREPEKGSIQNTLAGTR